MPKLCSVGDGPAAAPVDRARIWHDAITSALFPLNARPGDPDHFRGELQNWDLGDISLTRIDSEPVDYVRDRSHIRADTDERLLITFAGRSELHFEQERIRLACRPQQFFIEMAHLPYRFTQLAPDELWVLRVRAALLRWHVGPVEKFAPYAFDASCGIGALLFDMLRMMPQRLSEAGSGAHGRLTQSIVELLALALEQDDRVLGSEQGSVQAAHLARVERYIRQNLPDPELAPDRIAGACGISTRYLHGLFRASGTTVGRWIREQRLEACDRELRQAGRRGSIAELAHRWGFGDHAQFSRHYKAHFGRTPTEARGLGLRDTTARR